MVITGLALAVMVKLTGEPGQVPRVGVTTMVLNCVVAKFAGGVNEIFPLPEAGSPILALLFVQAKVAPAVPVKLAVTILPAQRLLLGTALIVGVASMVKITGVRFATQPVTGSFASA